MSIIAVFDTNILFSAVGWRGRPFQCVELARAGVIEGVTCRELLDELVEKLRSKLAFDRDQSLDEVADLLSFLQLVPIPGILKVIEADPDDDKVLECASAAKATHIVTGDRSPFVTTGQLSGHHDSVRRRVSCARGVAPGEQLTEFPL